MNPPNISIRKAYLSFENKFLFNDLNLSLRGGIWSCILGPSGIGKSTLLKLIAQLIPEHVTFKGQVFTDNNLVLSDNIAYMAQTDLLLPWLTVLENTLLNARLTGKTSTRINNKAKQLLEKVGLKEVMGRYPQTLSGGMRQRVALVRTLIQDKTIVLMDEPFSSLDAITRFELQNLFAELLANHTVILITHDPMEALRLGHDIYLLSGQPAKVRKTLTLSSPTPRTISHSEFIGYQDELFKELIKAKESVT